MAEIYRNRYFCTRITRALPTMSMMMMMRRCWWLWRCWYRCCWLSRWVVQKEEAPKSATDIQLDIDSQLSLLLFGIAVISSCRNTRSSLKLNFISSCGFLFLLLLLFCDKNVEIIVCYHLWHITKTADNNNNANKPSRNH